MPGGTKCAFKSPHEAAMAEYHSTPPFVNRFYTALVTFPERRQRVHTWIWREDPSTTALTRLTLGFQARLVCRLEWDTLHPKLTPLSQTLHLAM